MSLKTFTGNFVPLTIVNDTDLDDEDEDWHSVNSSTSVLEDTDIIAFRAQSKGVIGRIVVFSGGIRFVRSIGHKEIWRRSFLELTEMRKVEGSIMSRLTMVSRQRLEFKFTDGNTLMEGMRDRDDAFNTIVAFSGLQWYVQMPK